MKKKLHTYWNITKNTFKDFVEEDTMNYASIIAYSTVFSLPAVLIIIIRVAGAVFGDEAVRGELATQIEGLVGQESALQIQDMIENANQSGSGVIATIIGVATLIFSATTVFISLQNALNAVWDVKAKPKKGWLKLIINRVLSLAMVVSLGFLLLVSLSISVVLSVVERYLDSLFSGFSATLLQIANVGISLGVITVIFALIFKVLPDAKVKWKDAWVGAIVTTLLFTLGQLLIGLYLGNSSISSAYGAAGSLVLILVWVYYSSVILLLGAEFTQSYSTEMGRSIEPTDQAVRIETKEVKNEVDDSKSDTGEKQGTPKAAHS